MFYVDHPIEAMEVLKEIAYQKCEKFDEICAEHVKNDWVIKSPFCGKCKSCVASHALLLIEREAKRKSSA